MCCYSKVNPCFRTDDVTSVSMNPPNTELPNAWMATEKVHNNVQFQHHIPSVTYLVIVDCKLYCLMSNFVTINTTGTHPNVCTCICLTEAGNVNDIICHGHESYTMTNSCVPHNQYMKGHDTFDSYGSYIRSNPCVPHSIYMRDHDTYDDICGGK